MVALPKPDNRILDTIIQGDCLEVLRAMPACSVDAIVTDPPAGISFMGKDWDANKGSRDIWITWLSQIMAECLRVLKPGGHALVWALPRTSHWTATAIEDAGFEIRDVLTHLFGSGFPKSMDISKAIDRLAPRQGMFDKFAEHFREQRQASGLSQKQIAQHFPSKTGGMTGCVWNWENGANVPTLAQWHILQPMLNLSDEWTPLIEREEAEREVIGQQTKARSVNGKSALPTLGTEVKYETWDITAPSTPQAQQWQGYGTALKPANEHWILARKPLSEKSIAANVLKWGTGGLAIDASRVGDESTLRTAGVSPTNRNAYGTYAADHGNGKQVYGSTQGRFPSNLLLSHSLFCVPLGEKRVRGSHDNGYLIPRNATEVGFTRNGSGCEPAKGYTDTDGMETIQAWECTEDCPIRLLDEQSGIRRGNSPSIRNVDVDPGLFGGRAKRKDEQMQAYRDTGGASRYFTQFHPTPDDYAPFLYISKASRRERNQGCEGLTDSLLDSIDFGTMKAGGSGKPVPFTGLPLPRGNGHPCVKPLQLMSWLCCLITPPGGIVLDCFAGSGSTLVACVQEGLHFIGIEAEADYCAIARARLAYVMSSGVTSDY